MLNRAGSTKNIVGFAAKADKKERHRVRQLTPEEIAELQARLSSDPARVSTRPISVHFHRRPDRCPILIPNPTFPCLRRRRKPSTSSTRTTAARLTSAS